MPFKLIYGQAKGKAETARMLFALGGEEFEDVRQTKEEWEELKPKSPYGERPILELEDGKMIAQSRAIERFLAKKYGLLGSSDIEQAEVDMFIDCLNDIENTIMQLYTNREDKAKCDELKENFFKEKGPAKFNKLAAMFPEGKKFFLGDNISWPDVALLNTMAFFPLVGMTNIDEISGSKLKEVMKNVEAHSKIQAWVAKRPQSEY